MRQNLNEPYLILFQFFFGKYTLITTHLEEKLKIFWVRVTSFVINQGDHISLHARAGASAGFFPEGWRAWHKVQNSQGSPLGCVFRSPVSKITKGPPLVKIFGQIFDQKFFLTKSMVFLQRTELFGKYLTFYCYFTTENTSFCPKFCMTSIWDGAPGRDPREAHVEFRLKYRHFPIKYCSGRIIIRLRVFPACLHFVFASPAGREPKIWRFFSVCAEGAREK